MRNQQRLFSGYNDAQLFKIAVGLGQVQGWRWYRKFGQNDGVPATGSEEMWPPGTSRVLPTAAAVVSCVSTSTADDAVAVGTGAWTIKIEGLDENYDEIEDIVALDGTVPVLSDTTFLRVNRVYVVTAGTGNVNAGDISISISGDLQAYVQAAEGQTQQTHYTVPAGHTFVNLASKIGVGRMAGNTDCHVENQIKLATADSSWRALANVYIYNGVGHENSVGVTAVPAKTEFRHKITSTATTQCFGVLQGFLVENSELVSPVD